jgi:predicted Zn finger-like uncharacterized protein
MNVACSSCPAKYAVPDEKVRGRKVRITCKRCGAPIIVDGTQPSAFEAAKDAGGAPAGSTGGDAPKPDAAPAAAPAGALAGATPSDDADATKIGDSPLAAELAAAENARAANAIAKPAASGAAAEPGPPANVDAKPAATAEAKPAPAAGKLGGALKLPGAAKLGEAKAGPFAKLAGKAGGVGVKAAAVVKPAGVESPEPGADSATAAPGAEKPAPSPAAGKVAAISRTGAKGAAATPAASGAAARAAVGVPRTGAAARAIAPSAMPERTWTVAVTDDEHREMTLTQIVDAYAGKTIDAETFVWRDGMQDWLMPFEIAEIAAALRARRLTPRTNQPATGATEALPFGEDSGSGTWREPGRWDRDEPPPSEANFDDVTVAMAAPKAQALLEAVAAEGAAAAAGRPKSDGPTAVGVVTPEALGFGEGDEAAPSSPKLAGPAAGATPDREPEKLPFELAPSALPGRAMLRSESGESRAGAKPDLFAKRANDEESAPASAAPESVAAESVPAEGSPALTGARNESSVLFSLDQLTKTTEPTKKTPATKPTKKADEAALLLGDSAGGGGAPATVMGGLFGQTNMAAPDFTAPPPPSVPPVAPSKATTPSGSPAAAKPKSNTGLWIGLMLLLVGGAGGAVFLTRSPPPTPSATPTAEPPSTAPAAMAPTAALTAAPLDVPGSSGAPPASDSAAPATSATPGASALGTGSAAAPATSGAPATPSATVATAPGTTAAAPTSRPQTAAPKPSAAAEPAAAEGPDFDKDAASTALAGAAARAESECASQEGPHGTGKVSVTFVNSGRATNALVSGDFAGSALGGCIARVFRGAKVPAFGGDSVRVSKTVRIP